MFTKLQAAQLAGRSGTTTVMASGALPDVILAIVAGQAIGTTFLPSTPHRESRKRWLLSEKPSAAVRVDAGAVSKLRRHGASLLGVGITAVLGDFDRGDVVRVVSPDDHPLAVGIANYASSETQRLVGVRSGQIETVLGYSYGDEIIHRDNMVIL
jgi:glutamate 5-kinase